MIDALMMETRHMEGVSQVPGQQGSLVAGEASIGDQQSFVDRLFLIANPRLETHLTPENSTPVPCLIAKNSQFFFSRFHPLTTPFSNLQFGDPTRVVVLSDQREP